ncbi:MULTISPECIES: hypothetical protein [unclassified Streptomyces]|uniref:hypothetical protein n=1 Tax=unclassified Streptomyces TaxID=2593676 RepID=UPI00344DCB9C
MKNILVLAERIARDAECLSAVAVDTALRHGGSWQDIAVAAELSRGAATARWGGTRVSDLLAARVRPRVFLTADEGFSAGTASAVPPVPYPRPVNSAVPGVRRALGAALGTLGKVSHTSLSEAAAATGLPLATVMDMVAGRTVEPWLATYAVAHALRGEPRDVLHLWELASDQRLPTDASSGTDRLAAALRGAWLAAGSPSLAIVSDVDVAVVRAALCGQVVPPWPVVTELLGGLGADPALFEPLWVVARAAQLESGERAVSS